MSGLFTITGHLVDVVGQAIFPAKISIKNGRIADITRQANVPERFICPGFIDAHIHIESSLLVPSEFARLAVRHGTVGTVSDPHEIANVLGVRGVEYMIHDGKQVPFYFCWGAPSCVPATSFETAGAELGPAEIRKLLAMEEVGYLAEVMNFPGVVDREATVMEKIAVAKELGKPIDGHAPGLRGPALAKYIGAGIETCHESLTLDEAREKVALGMKILLREGSAARNLDELLPLLLESPESCMFCSDDLHPSALLKGHINLLIRRALNYGVPFLAALRAATLNPIKHYRLKTGLLREGDYADFVVIPDIRSMDVEATYVKGQQVASEGHERFKPVKAKEFNNFKREAVSMYEVEVPASEGMLRVIQVLDGQLLTLEEHLPPLICDQLVTSNPDSDILKLVIVNRYDRQQPPAVAFVKGFGLKRGAMACSISHDSHNITGIGANDRDLVEALNQVIKHRGGMVVCEGKDHLVLPLPVAGLMSNEQGQWVAEHEEQLDKAAKELGATLKAPFTMLSFLSLLVIPQLKLSDKGLFDGGSFQFVSNFVPVE